VKKIRERIEPSAHAGYYRPGLRQLQQECRFFGRNSGLYGYKPLHTESIPVPEAAALAGNP
jgi:hypothetical protein